MRIIVDIDDATGAVTITPETQDPEAAMANPEAVECVADGLTHEFRDAPDSYVPMAWG
jgi:putative hemolysin